VASGARPDHENSESMWVVYAWPLEAGRTGQRAFFLDAKTNFLIMDDADGAYGGEAQAPAFDAAFSRSWPGTLRAPLCAADGQGNDRHAWVQAPW
jgi:hypothetical protein